MTATANIKRAESASAAGYKKRRSCLEVAAVSTLPDYRQSHRFKFGVVPVVQIYKTKECGHPKTTFPCVCIAGAGANGGGEGE
jgi:hypothetical protein